MTIGIVGSRSRNSQADYHLTLETFTDLIASKGIADVRIVSGGCPQGGDAFAERIAKVLQIPITIYYAEWGRLGKSAGFQRNGLIAADADVLIACVAADRTGGTEDTIKKFQKLHPDGQLITI